MHHPIILSRDNCALLRGIAILAIMLHNFCHLMPTAIPENEFDFDLSRSVALIHALCHPSAGIISHVFSFFGHYGVSIFVFLCGYGLVRKYEEDKAPLGSFVGFMRKHAVKFWRIIIPGTLMFVAVVLIFDHTFWWRNKFVYLQLVYVANLFPGAIIMPYIYWYLGMAMQLYALYYLAFRHCNTRHLILAGGLQLALQCGAMMLPDGARSVYMLDYIAINSPAWLIAFSFGIYAARHGVQFMQQPRAIVAAAVLFVAGQFVAWLWPLTGICFVVLIMAVAIHLRDGIVKRGFYSLGRISMWLYMFHPITREIFLYCNPTITSYGLLLAYIGSTILLAYLTSYVARRW
jgi:peptidoglycan/LPS O-acetylase OafA/YrhL